MVQYQAPTFSVRFRFRLSTPVPLEEETVRIAIAGREIELSRDAEKTPAGSDWFTINAHSFVTEREAQAFARDLKAAMTLAGIRRNLGIDAGDDRASTGLGKKLIDDLADKGIALKPNVHGIEVYLRRGNEQFISFSANATVHMQAKAFSAEIKAAFSEIERVGDRERSALELMALANIASHPLARASLSLAAVELLSSGGGWTDPQKQLLKRLQQEALNDSSLPPAEAALVGDSIGRAFRLSIRQSVKAKMAELGLSEEDWREFDGVYGLRSKVFHGGLPSASAYQDLSRRAVTICTKIVEAATTC